MANVKKMRLQHIMTKIIYKTRPKLFILITPILGAIFFSFLFWLTYTSAKGGLDIITLSLLTFFATISLILFFYSFNVTTVILTTENIIISYLLFPVRKTVGFKNIESISQKTKDIYGSDWYASFIYTSSITTFCLSDNKQITLRSIGKLDFEEFYKAYNKLRRNEGKIKKERLGWFNYMIDNLDGIFWGILLLVLTIGLGHELLTRLQ